MNPYISTAFILLGYMTIVYIIASLIKDNSIADVAWGGGFIAVALYSFFLEPGFKARHLLSTILVLIWGIRLCLHIFVRNHGKGEDPRYKKWREDWGKTHLIKAFFYVFMFQGLLLYFVAYPLIMINMSDAEGLLLTDYAGIAVWLIGIIMETTADYQLASFKKKPQNKGKVMDRGLWRYSRHPNYFGEALAWWGIFIIALSIPGGWKAFFSPVLITFLLRYVSGVPLLEERMMKRPDYVKYAKRTSIFIPWFPKK